jgi:hypothetical protein
MVSSDVLLIHDNGGRPFKVVLHPQREKPQLEVFVGQHKAELKGWDYSNHWKTFEYDEIFIGQGVYDSVEYCDFSYGNAVLIRLKSDESVTVTPSLQYVYIGSQIVQFPSQVRIEKFISTVGNSDVPYSFARDINGGHYFFQGCSLVDFVASIPTEIVNGRIPGGLYGFFYKTCCSNDFEGLIAVDAILLHAGND